MVLPRALMPTSRPTLLDKVSELSTYTQGHPFSDLHSEDYPPDVLTDSHLLTGTGYELL